MYKVQEEPDAKLQAAAQALPPCHEESIAKQHKLEAFDCGDTALSDFLRRYARQTHDLGGAKTFVAVRDD